MLGDKALQLSKPAEGPAPPPTMCRRRPPTGEFVQVEYCVEIMNSTAAPPIETQRLSLRSFMSSDATAIVALAGDWDVARMLADMPYPLDEHQAGAWTESGPKEAAFAITLGGCLIGGVMLCDAATEGTPAEAELGFWLGRPWWGHGYAREAAQAAVDWSFSNTPIEAIGSGRFVDNPASGRVLTALGFIETGDCLQWCLARAASVPAVRYELRREHWLRQPASASRLLTESVR